MRIGLRAALLHGHPSLCAGGVSAGKQAGRQDQQHHPRPSTQAGAAKGCRVVDAAPAPAVHGATFVQLETLNGPVEGLDKDDKLLIVCSKGKRAYFMQNRLRSYGYTNTLCWRAHLLQ